MDRQILRNIAEVPAEFFLILSEIFPHEFDRTEGRAHNIADHVHGGGFTGAIRSQKSEDLTLLDLDIEIIYDHFVSVLFRQIRKLQNRFHFFSSP